MQTQQGVIIPRYRSTLRELGYPCAHRPLHFKVASTSCPGPLHQPWKLPRINLRAESWTSPLRAASLLLSPPRLKQSIMSTPAANKRRRVDAANVTLRKPFHSPVLRRPDATGGPSKTPEQTKAASNVNAYSPNCPSIPPPNRALHALRPPPHRRPASPLKFKTPIHRSGVKRKATGPVSDLSGGDGDDHPGADILALIRGHRSINQNAVLKDLERKVDMVRQARRIEEASEKERPGKPVDQELRELVEKWKAASRTAAEEVFVVVRERVAKYVLDRWPSCWWLAV